MTTPTAPTPTSAARKEFRVVVAGAADDVTGAGDQFQLGHECGQAAVPLAGAVCAGGQRAGDRLHIDVAEVRHGEPVPGQLGVEGGQLGAGLDPDEL